MVQVKSQRGGFGTGVPRILLRGVVSKWLSHCICVSWIVLKAFCSSDLKEISSETVKFYLEIGNVLIMQNFSSKCSVVLFRLMKPQFTQHWVNIQAMNYKPFHFEKKSCIYLFIARFSSEEAFSESWL